MHWENQEQTEPHVSLTVRFFISRPYSADDCLTSELMGRLQPALAELLGSDERVAGIEVEMGADSLAGAYVSRVRRRGPMRANLSMTGREPYHVADGHAWRRDCIAFGCTSSEPGPTRT
jgi:hypothetical protein